MRVQEKKRREGGAKAARSRRAAIGECAAWARSRAQHSASGAVIVQPSALWTRSWILLSSSDALEQL